MTTGTVPVPVAPHESVAVKVKVTVVADRSCIGLAVFVVVRIVPKAHTWREPQLLSGVKPKCQNILATRSYVFRKYHVLIVVQC